MLRAISAALHRAAAGSGETIREELAMMSGLRITYRGVEPTGAIDEYVRRRAERLTRRGPTVSSCRVVVDAPHRHKRRGRHYVVHVEVSTPVGRLVVDHSPGEARAVEDLYAAIDAAFDHAVRRLDEEVERLGRSERYPRAFS